MIFPTRSLLPLLAFAGSISAQTFSACNPLTNPGACPPNPALGKSASIDLQSPSDSFTEHGTIQYGSDGAAFTVARSGDNPTISSKWYIMFGHVEFVVKAAPGTGIVSSAVLMSDCLDEIDWEWLGGDNEQVQSNYFRKGQTVTGYNRGAFHSAPGSHDNFHTYAIDWTAEQIVWSIDGNTVRVLEAGNAENGDYPQTPMQIKLGSWAGGDPGNPQGTIEWAGGVTDYSQGPFTMYVKSVAVTDYSTGSTYSYSGTTGDWESIQSDGGQVNPSGNGRPASADNAPPVTSTVPGGSPLAFDPHDSASVYATRTGWPWDGTATASVVPSGWSIDGNGNLHPPSSGAIPSPSASSSPQASYPGFSSSFGPETAQPTVAGPSAEAPPPGFAPTSGPEIAPTASTTTIDTPVPTTPVILPTAGPATISGAASATDDLTAGTVSASSQSQPGSSQVASPSAQNSENGITTTGTVQSQSTSVSGNVSESQTTISTDSIITASASPTGTSTSASTSSITTSETTSETSSSTINSSTLSTSTLSATTSEPSSTTTTTDAAQSPTETPPAPDNGSSRSNASPLLWISIIVVAVASLC